jgi:PhnB protein
MKLNTYLNFHGNCEEAFAFYAKNLGGKVLFSQRWRESPMSKDVSAETQDKIIHSTIEIGDTVLMGSDDMRPQEKKPASGYAITISTDSPDEAERLFNILAEGGTVGMPLAQTFWAVRFGMLTDRFGIPWMINCEAAAK